MNQAADTKVDYMGLLRRRWYVFAVVTPAIIFLALLLAYTITPQYRATATILIEGSSVSSELIQSTVNPLAYQQIEIVQRRVMAKEQLLEMLKELDPYPEIESPSEKVRQIDADTQIERVDPVTLAPLDQSNAFNLYYSNSDRNVAAAMAGRLATLFTSYNRRTRAEAAAQASDFLKEQSSSLLKTIREYDQKLADFKQKHGDAMPEAMVRNEMTLDRAQRDLDSVQQQIRAAEDREAMLRVQMNAIPQTLVGTVTDPRIELATLRAQLAEANQRYTPDHPDIKRLQRAIEGLAARIGEASSGSGLPVPDNPDYLAVSGQHQAEQRQLVALRAAEGRTRAQIADLQRRLSSTPTVERDLMQMMRDFEAAKVQYNEIQAKLRNAELAQNLETESETLGERFTVIREPYAPDTPFSPNRLGFILLGIVLGAGIAVGLAVWLDVMDPNVRSTADLAEITNLPIIGGVPPILNAEDRHRRLVMLGSLSAVYLLAIAIVGYTVATADSRFSASAGVTVPVDE